MERNNQVFAIVGIINTASGRNLFPNSLLPYPTPYHRSQKNIFCITALTCPMLWWLMKWLSFLCDLSIYYLFIYIILFYYLSLCCFFLHPWVQVPLEMVTQSHSSYVEAEVHAPTLDELGTQVEDSGASFHTYLDQLVQNLQKEAKEKFKGWVTCSSTDNTDLAFKKVILGGRKS